MNQDFLAIEEAFPNEFKDFQHIGRGAYAKVYKATNKNDELVAIKVIDIKNMQKEIIPYMENEVKLLQESNNENIIKLYKSMQTQERVFLVMEFCSLDVEFLVKRHYKGKLPDELAITILRQLANGLSYLHKKRVIHRDLKLENFAVSLSIEDQKKLLNQQDISVFYRAKYKLIDLGLAKQLSEVQKCTSTWAGTELNMAPEILEEQNYSYEADMYSLGVCMFYMVVGKYPYFDPTNRIPQQELIKRENADFNQIQNQQLRELIQQMLRYSPQNRITWEQLYEHPYLKYKQGDLQSPLDLELDRNKTIYQQGQQQQQQVQVEFKFERKSDFQIKQIDPYAQLQQQQPINSGFPISSVPQFQQSTNSYQNKQNETNQIYNPNQKEKDLIDVLFNIRNQYLAIWKLSDYLSKLVAQVKQSKFTFFTMESKFGMYINYLQMVAKQLFQKIQLKFTFYEPRLGAYDNFNGLRQKVQQEDSNKFASVVIKEGDSGGFFKSLQKAVFKTITCEPHDSVNFNSQYQQINIEIYNELLKMLQDTFYKQKEQDQHDPLIQGIKCLLYLSMINTARSRVLFQVQINNVDYKQEELSLEKYRNEPDYLSEKVTAILSEYNLVYDLKK